MSSPVGTPLPATVLDKTVLTDHLIRLRLAAPGFTSTGILDEWVALTVPGQYQNRYYTIRSIEGDELTVDIVVHEQGLVTEWAQTDCVGDEVGLGTPKGSFLPAPGASWLVLAGDLTALPAISRIVQHTTDLPVQVVMEAPDDTRAAYPQSPDGRWVSPPRAGHSDLAGLVREIDWPDGPGYFWMAGESAQMREIRRHLRHQVGFPTTAYDVMGYWSTGRGRQRRAVDPRPAHVQTGSADTRGVAQ